jgi:cysteine-rich repeat protein
MGNFNRTTNLVTLALVGFVQAILITGCPYWFYPIPAQQDSSTSESGGTGENTTTASTTGLSTSSASTAFQMPVCGNGELEAGEICDDGNVVEGDGCESDCRKTPFCGDGILDPGEQCDEGDQNGGGVCELNCTKTPVCGDEYKDPGEECDDGNEDSNDACVACKKAVCGDGIVYAGFEECDDGNPINTDACLNECKDATCGDQIVQAGVEECDDGNAVDDDLCSNECVKPRIVFITSEERDGALGGLQGADLWCATLAQKAGLTGSWRAWLSDNFASPAILMDTNFLGYYVLPSGSPVAKGWTGLISGNLQTSISETETQEIVEQSPAWTNTSPEGTSLGELNCYGWTAPYIGLIGWTGDSTAKNVKWTNDTATPCGKPSRLYCFQDTAE